MKLGGGIVGLALVCALALLAPAGAGAVDSDLKYGYAFKAEGSNGYSIVALAANERADGRGEIVLIVSRKRESAVYSAPALLTATSLKANLGALGRVSLEVTPSGREKKLQPRRGCKGEGPTTYEPVSFSGRFEFRGEEGYAEATSEAPTEYTRLFLDLLCFGRGQGETVGVGLRGARLRVRSLGGGPRFELQANKNRPDKRSRFEVDLREERGPVSISRHTEVWLGATAFQYDPLLETATLQPPAPFSGRANFYRRLAPESRWSGNLTVDLPGRSDLSLTGPGTQATLVPACLSTGKRTGRHC